MMDILSSLIHNRLQLLASLFLLCTPVSSLAQAPEYGIKAVYMKNFTDFVEWPVESSISDTTRPFIIGVIGRNPFGNILDDAYSTITIKNKRVEIRYLTDMSEISDCHLLFIASNRRRQLSEILSITENKPILTVSDTEGFAEEGVHINLYVEDKKLRFEINESAIRESGCSVSYHLLRVATIISRPDRK